MFSYVIYFAEMPKTIEFGSFSIFLMNLSNPKINKNPGN